MKDNYEMPAVRNNCKQAIGVNGYSVFGETYNPKIHNPPSPKRLGAYDAMQLPSLDAAGNRTPYWGNKGE